MVLLDLSAIECHLVVLDLSAAFDSDDHYLLMDVHSSQFEVADQVYEWFHSYIPLRSNRFFSTPAGTFNAVVLLCSVPQGSAVGPLMFNSYT